MYQIGVVILFYFCIQEDTNIKLLVMGSQVLTLFLYSTARMAINLYMHTEMRAVRSDFV